MPMPRENICVRCWQWWLRANCVLALLAATSGSWGAFGFFWIVAMAAGAVILCHEFRTDGGA